MSQKANYKHETYDLEERTFEFSRRVNAYVRKLPKDTPNNENGKQLVRAAGSIGANYIEANKAMSKKDFAHRIKASKKEAKESRYWLRLTQPGAAFDKEKNELLQGVLELMKILGSIAEKSK